MHYTHSLVNKAMPKYTGDPEKLSPLAKIEVAHRFDYVDIAKDELPKKKPLHKQFDAILAQHSNIGDAANALISLTLLDEPSLGIKDRKTLFGICAEALFLSRQYQRTIEFTLFAHLSMSADVSMRSCYFLLKSLVAVGHYRQALTIGDLYLAANQYGHAPIQIAMAEAARSNSNFNRAAELYTQAHQSVPESSGPLTALGFLASKLKRPALQKSYQAMQATKKRHGELFVTLSEFASHLNLKEEANQYAQSSIRARSSNKVEKAGGHFNNDSLREPHFIILGLPKCGTTSAYSSICAHPHALRAARKEVGFFGQNYSRGIDWYRSHFANAIRNDDQPFVTGEASPGYLVSKTAIDRIAKHCKKSRLLVFFRNPTERVISGFYQRKKMHGISGTIEQFFDDQFARDKAGEKSILATGHYLGLHQYCGQTLGKDRLLLTCSERLFAQPKEAMEKIFNHLELDPAANRREFPADNVGAYPDASPELVTRLDSYFAPLNENFFEYIGEDLGWNADR